MANDQNPSIIDPLLTVQQVAKLTGLASGSIYHFLSAGRIPVIRLSKRCVRFRTRDIEEWLDAMSHAVRNK